MASIRRSSVGDVERRLLRAKAAQQEWADRPVRERLAIVEEFRCTLADSVEKLVGAVRLPWRASAAETISAEVLPLADACRYLTRRAEALLAPRRLGLRRRPLWLVGSSARIHREPLGLVLIIGPSNYPLLLPGVQSLQALVAGNAVLLKPGRDAGAAAEVLLQLWTESGLPQDLLQVLDESPRSAAAVIEAGVDKVLLTGSAETGRIVQERLASSLTPSVMELSGCDAAFVREDADLELAARALCFGVTFNGGFTCIAPRRIFVARRRVAELERRLVGRLRAMRRVPIDPTVAQRVGRMIDEAVADGARLAFGEHPIGETTTPLLLAETRPSMRVMHADLAVPLMSLAPVDDDDQALQMARSCDYELGATVFGKEPGATELARRVRAGVVVINDMIVPTADPRLPFGGRGASGFGVTRGDEGLLELTRPKSVIRRGGRFRPHLEPLGPVEEEMLTSFVALTHGRSWRRRCRSLWSLLKTGRRLSRGGREVGRDAR